MPRVEVLLQTEIAALAAGGLSESDPIRVMPVGLGASVMRGAAPSASFLRATVAADQAGVLSIWEGFEADLGVAPNIPADLNRINTTTVVYAAPAVVSVNIALPSLPFIRVRFTNGGVPIAAYLRVYVYVVYL